MAPSASNGQLVLARIVALALISFFLAGILWYGLSYQIRTQTWMDLADRGSGPLSFRFVLQPCVAGFAALRDGVRDAQLGRRPYLQEILGNANRRGQLLFDGIIATSRVLLLGLLMDVAYQWIELRSFHPTQAAIMAIALAFLPYLLLRGPVTRLAQWWIGDRSGRAG